MMDIQAIDARYAAESTPDVSADQIGSVYAQSLIDAIDGNTTQLAELVEEFDSFLTVYFDNQPMFEKILASRLIAPEDKAGILDRTLVGAAPVFKNFLKVVVKHERMDILRAIYRQLYLKYEQMIGRRPVEITTAAEISAEEAQRIGESLQAKIGGEPIIRQKVDPSLIGGVVVRVGDTVYDGSISTQLKLMRERIAEAKLPE